MKNIIWIFLLFATIFIIGISYSGCNSKNENKNKPDTVFVEHKYDPLEWINKDGNHWHCTTTIDGCEYICIMSQTWRGYYIISMTHKGNCNNPIHNLQKGNKDGN